MNEKNYYVFRINYDVNYEMVRDELLKGRLRQGWGAEGMSVRGTAEEFEKVWVDKWGENDAETAYIHRKYRNISIMKEFKAGDIVVIPKVNNTNKDGWQSFTIVKCIGEYRFETLGGDFGHIVPVKVISSCPYEFNDWSRVVAAKLKAYQSSVNRAYSQEFKDAVDKLLEAYEKDNSVFEGKCLTSLEAVAKSTKEKRDLYLKEIVNEINKWQPAELERIISGLFEKNGYVKIANNRYDREGGDIDLVFGCFGENTLMGDLFAIANAGDYAKPEIRIQAKKKVNTDTNDKEGIIQLEKMKDYERAINILINLTDEFSEETKNEASEKGIVLINGIDFAYLLVRHGINVIDL